MLALFAKPWAMTLEELRTFCECCSFVPSVLLINFLFYRINGSYTNRSVYDPICSDIGFEKNLDPSRIQANMCSFQAVIQPDDCPTSPQFYAGVSCGKFDACNEGAQS